MTLLDKLKLTGNRPSGFDYLRIILAIAVVCQHSLNTTFGLPRTMELLETTPLRIPFALILPMFFALSGFLVTGSLLRSKSLVSFIGLRCFRIIPALAVEVVISALVIGPILTTFSLHDYFSDRKFASYFLNVVGDIHYFLPGIFLTNPWPAVVNAQLWTIPFELQCYLAISLLAIVGFAFSPRAMMIFLALGQVALFAYVLIRNPQATAVVRGPLLVVSFLFGCGFFLCRDKIPYNGMLALLSCALCLPALYFRYGDFFVSAPATYLTCYIGLSNPKKSTFLQSGDYSYGVYLYGFPIQQVFASIGDAAHYWWLNIIVCVPASLLVAVGSWHLVEKHALKARTVLSTLEQVVIKRLPFIAFGSAPLYRRLLRRADATSLATANSLRSHSQLTDPSSKYQ
jgi:peptidoglycan/LPS O-acetylase OafA/YrhL